MLKINLRMALSALLALLIYSGHAPAEVSDQLTKNEKAIERAMKAMFSERTEKKLRILEHDFNFYPAEISVRRSGWVIMKGHISHHLTARPDDKIEYTIKKKDGVVEVLELKVQPGGLSKWVRLYGKFLNPVILSGPSGKLHVKAMQGTGWLVDGGNVVYLRGGWNDSAQFKRDGEHLYTSANDWKEVASFIVSIAALRLDDNGHDALRPPHTASPSPERGDRRRHQSDQIPNRRDFRN